MSCRIAFAVALALACAVRASETKTTALLLSASGSGLRSGTLSMKTLCSGDADSVRGRWVEEEEEPLSTRWQHGGSEETLRHDTPRLNCGDNGNGNATAAYVRVGGCSTLSVAESLTRLASAGAKLHLVGDSVMNQLWKAIHFHSASPDFLFMGGWRCAPRTTPEADALFGKLGSFSSAASDGDDVLLMNLGLWYNLRCSSDSTCAFNDPVPALLKAYKAGDEEALAPAPMAYEPEPVTAVEDVDRQATCKRRRKDVLRTDESPEQAYAKDLIRLARYIADNRARLPRHIFWIDAPPQHFGETGTFAQEGWALNPEWVTTTMRQQQQQEQEQPKCRQPSHTAAHLLMWRNDVARRILSVVAPSVRLIHTAEFMTDRAQDHAPFVPGGPTKDCTHWCENSPAFREHAATVLTAVVRAVEEADTDTDTEAAAAAACEQPGVDFYVLATRRRCKDEAGTITSRAQCREAFEDLRRRAQETTTVAAGHFIDHGQTQHHYPNGCSVWLGSSDTGEEEEEEANAAVVWNGNMPVRGGPANPEHATVCACLAPHRHAQTTAGEIVMVQGETEEEEPRDDVNSGGGRRRRLRGAR